MKKLLLVLPLLMILSACNPNNPAVTESNGPVLAKEEKPAVKPTSPTPVPAPPVPQPNPVKPKVTYLKSSCQLTEVVAITDKETGKTQREHTLAVTNQLVTRSYAVKTKTDKTERKSYNAKVIFGQRNYTFDEDGSKKLTSVASWETEGHSVIEHTELGDSKFVTSQKNTGTRTGTNGYLFKNKDGTFSHIQTYDNNSIQEFYEDDNIYYLIKSTYNGVERPGNKDEVYLHKLTENGKKKTEVYSLQKPYLIRETEKQAVVQELSYESCNYENLDSL